MQGIINSRGIRPLRGWALTATTAVFIAILGPLAMAAAAFTFGSTQKSTEGQIGQALLGSGALFMILAWPVVGVLVVGWLVRARANAGLLAPTGHRLPSWWAIVGWLIPIVNFVVPVIVVSDVVRASNPAGQNLRAVFVWWISWLVAPILLAYGFFQLNRSGFPEGAVVLGRSLLGGTALYVVAALSFRSLALTVARWQDERMASAQG
ncbi:DUF4328 domain-containing protein [Nocardia zapadnayensis]|nr:DUF4328 domain-containing protein [Nocardia zapadnayensis]MCX0270933.1 DUF4328 domain-containing protein [Nocardia zapadnayensis]